MGGIPEEPTTGGIDRSGKKRPVPGKPKDIRVSGSGEPDKPDEPAMFSTGEMNEPGAGG